jgi:thiosulfate oxidation carrier complex protein SoxZ
MARPIRLRAAADERGVLVKALLSHPMQNGFGKDADGLLIPAHHIVEVTVSVNGSPVVGAYVGSGVAADPLFSWRLKDAKSGDRVTIAWRDNRGEREEKTVAVA